MTNPNFLIIGETKCGTTSLFEDLTKHPHILPAIEDNAEIDYEGGALSLSQKEIRFFDRHWDKGLKWYSQKFKPTYSKSITGEASPTYFYRFLAMQRIHQILPNIKMILMLRNPVDRLYSHFNHIIKIAPKWKQRYASFQNFVDTAHENDYYIIDKGIYINSLRRCYKLFAKEQILIVRSEDMFKHPQSTYNTIIKFLGLSKYIPNTFMHLRHSDYSNDMEANTRAILNNLYRPFNKDLYNLINRDMKW